MCNTSGRLEGPSRKVEPVYHLLFCDALPCKSGPVPTCCKEEAPVHCFILVQRILREE